MCAARAARVAASQVIIDSVVPGSTIVSARVLLGSEPAAIHFVQAAIFPRRVWNFTYGFNETQFSQPLRCSAELVIDEEDNEAGIPIIAIYVGIAVIACLVLAALGFAIYHCGQRNARYSVKDSKKNVIAQNQPRNNETIELEAVDVMTMTGGKAGRL